MLQLGAGIVPSHLLQRHQRVRGRLNPGRIAIAPRPAFVRNIQLGLDQMKERKGAHGETMLRAHHAEQPVHRADDVLIVHSANAGQRDGLRGHPGSILDFAAGPDASICELPGTNQFPGAIERPSEPGVPCNASIA